MRARAHLQMLTRLQSCSKNNGISEFEPKSKLYNLYWLIRENQIVLTDADNSPVYPEKYIGQIYDAAAWFKLPPSNDENEQSHPELPKIINLFNPAEAVLGKYMGPNGAVSSANTLCYSAKIDVQPGDVLSFWRGHTLAHAPRFITAFNAKGEALSDAGTNSPEKTYTVPNDVASMIITIYTDSLNVYMIFRNNPDKPTEYVAYNESLIPLP